MNLSTSYFAKLKYVPNPVSISQKTPDWANVGTYPKLAPPWSLVTGLRSGALSPAQYTSDYHRLVLSGLNAVEVVNDIVGQFGSNASLLCYETPRDICHRRIVAEWIQSETGIVVPELVLR